METKKRYSQTRIGDLRPNQMIYSYGIGSIVDLPHFSALVMGLDDWQLTQESAPVIVEPRLLQAVQSRISFRPRYLRTLPIPPEGHDSNGYSGVENWTGVPVKLFPTWFYCSKCNCLTRYRPELFEFKSNPVNPARVQFIHKGCSESKRGRSIARPIRFMTTCLNGHLNDFPWLSFVHGDKGSCGQPNLIFTEDGPSGEARELWVKCLTCATGKKMSQAFDKDHWQYPCDGNFPHLQKQESCKEPSRPIIMGASNLWFPITLSTITIPESTNPLEDHILKNWDKLYDIEDKSELKSMRKFYDFLEGSSDEEVMECIHRVRIKKNQPSKEDYLDTKTPEWLALSAANPQYNNDDFSVQAEFVHVNYKSFISKVVLVDRLREVNALLGFSRLESIAIEEGFDDEATGHAKMVPLCRTTSDFIPVTEVRGEGIFIELDETVIQKWLDRPEVQFRSRQFEKANKTFFAKRNIPEKAPFPGMRYVLLHSLAHALMRQLNIESGYPAASLKERIFSKNTDEESGSQSGILIYTAAADSEGTLGGLVEMGKTKNLTRLLSHALYQVQFCASDPLCAESVVNEGYTIHGAACHACLFVSETSCERGNRFLDRAVLSPFVESEGLSFFR